jgi:lactate permease
VPVDILALHRYVGAPMPEVTWRQIYDPLNAWPVSTAIAALPVITLFFVLVVLRQRVWVAALAGMVVAIAGALLVFGMPATFVGNAALLGLVFGMTRVAWIIIASMFLYSIAVETGQFEVMKHSIASLSADRRLQAVLIAFCFGAFLEGTGGGGAPVAIAGAFLIGLGFPPFQASVLCLLANTAPVAWGAVGNPIRVLAAVTALPEAQLSAMTGRILPVFSLILPIWLVRTMTTWRGTREVLPALFVAGGSFAAMQYFWSNHMDTGLVDIVSAIFSLLVTMVLLKFWRPPHIESVTQNGALSAAGHAHSTVQVIRGWSPFILSSMFIFLLGLQAVNAHLKFAPLTFPLLGLHHRVLKVPPVAAVPTPESAIIDLNVLALPGTAVFVGAFIAGALFGLRIRRMFILLGRTLRQLVPSLLAISFMVGLAFITRYAGMDAVMGLTMTRTGWSYPFFGTLLGWLGVALTGTDAGSNALFGNLQRVTAEQLHVSPVLMAAANSAGGVMGKMIDAQSIVVSSVATQQEGNEAAIFKVVFPHSIALASLVGLLVLLYAYVWVGVVPAS